MSSKRRASRCLCKSSCTFSSCAADKPQISRAPSVGGRGEPAEFDPPRAYVPEHVPHGLEAAIQLVKEPEHELPWPRVDPFLRPLLLLMAGGDSFEELRDSERPVEPGREDEGRRVEACLRGPAVGFSGCCRGGAAAARVVSVLRRPCMTANSKTASWLFSCWLRFGKTRSDLGRLAGHARPQSTASLSPSRESVPFSMNLRMLRRTWAAARCAADSLSWMADGMPSAMVSSAGTGNKSGSSSATPEAHARPLPGMPGMPGTLASSGARRARGIGWFQCVRCSFVASFVAARNQVSSGFVAARNQVSSGFVAARNQVSCFGATMRDEFASPRLASSRGAPGSAHKTCISKPQSKSVS